MRPALERNFIAYNPSVFSLNVPQGLLVFFKDGSTLQIVCASMISLFFIVVYGYVAPFFEVSDDRLATFAQLATFVQLFAAILLAEGVMDDVEGGEGAIGIVMVIFNAGVVLFNVISKAGVFEIVSDSDKMDGCIEAAHDIALPCLAVVGLATAASQNAKSKLQRSSSIVLENANDTVDTKGHGAQKLIDHKLHELADKMEGAAEAAVEAVHAHKHVHAHKSSMDTAVADLDDCSC